MANLMTSFYTGVSGLKVNNSSLNTTAHNIANVDTEGVTRQQILSKDACYVKVGVYGTGTSQVGLGTDMERIRQVRDVFLDKSYRLELGRQGFYEEQYKAVEEIENCFGEISYTGVAFSEDISDLWSAVSELAKEPDSIVKRGLLVSTATSFLNRAQVISEQLSNYQESLNKQIIEKVNRINAIGDSIAQLNTTIVKYEATGQAANDYRDKRNMLLDELGGLVRCSYSEDSHGYVSVLIEGTQFIEYKNTYHLATRKITTDSAKATANEINELAKSLAEKIQSGDNSADAIKQTDEWKKLKEYGAMTCEENGGIIKVKMNDNVLIEDGKPYRVLPEQSELLDVVWAGTSENPSPVFRMTGDYSTADNTDVGSLKGLLVARGSFEANYTDIPVAADFYDENGVFEQGKYNEAVEEYNKLVDSTIIGATQAQFDQLVHSIVTVINDTLSPNTDLDADSISSLMGTNHIEIEAAAINTDTVKITMPDGTVLGLDDDIQVLNEAEAPIGMDADETMGSEIFSRKTVERYAEAELTFEDADGNTYTRTIKVYNKEYDSDVCSLYTLEQLEMNTEVLNDYSKIALSANPAKGLSGGYDMEACTKLLDAWDAENLYLNPNTLTSNNFADYYTAMTDSISNRGNVYNGQALNQEKVVADVDNKRQAIMGISSDEELTNLIKYQHAYNASSRYINVINEMLEHIIMRL